MNDFDKFKKFCLDKLSNKLRDSGKIKSTDIDEEIENINKIIEGKMAEIVFGSILKKITEEEKIKLKKEMEMHFAITVENGILISNNDIERDTTWWSNKVKVEKNDDLYYWNRYKKLSEGKLPIPVIRVLDEDTDVIMDNIENPMVENFSRYGMVVGHVQSGKTGNYSGLICKAADAGYKFIVVIAGGIDNLRNQTQNRLNENFVGKEGGKDLEIKSISGFDNLKQPFSLTTHELDFNKKDADKASLNFDNLNVPVLLVIKKNVTTLKNVIRWINGHTKGRVLNHAMLLIDDESDYASVNYKDDEDPAKINKEIRKLISKFSKSSYVAYTATPFANIFINHKASNLEVGDDLFPKHFIYALKAPDNYIGAKQYFGEDEKDIDKDYKYLSIIYDFKEQFPFKQKTNHSVTGLPESLKEAIRLFLMNISVRNLRENKKEHNSMLVHVSRFTNVHEMVTSFITDYFEEIKKEILAFGCLSTAIEESKNINEIEKTYKKYLIESEFEFNKILSNLTQIISTVIIREVHQKSKIPLKYRNDVATNVIAVGGTSLSRGYTLEGLSISYFTRNSQFYDTLMQMGRWFGYRKGYEGLCKVFIPQDIVNNFKQIIDATDELMIRFETMRMEGKTPEDFGLGIKYHPQTQLQITAKNKMKNTTDYTIKVNLDGILYEKTDLFKEEFENKKNLEITKKFISKIINDKKIIEEEIKDSTRGYVISDIDGKDVLNFFEDLKTLQTNRNIVFEFIKKYFKEKNMKVDVVIFSTQKGPTVNVGKYSFGTASRKLILNEKYLVVNKNKISDSNPEKILSKKYKELTSKEIRIQMEKPLLMLHFLTARMIINKYTNEEVENKKNLIYPTFGISFPSNGESNNDTIVIKGNSVYQENIDFEEEIDDDFSEE